MCTRPLFRTSLFLVFSVALIGGPASADFHWERKPNGDKRLVSSTGLSLTPKVMSTLVFPKDGSASLFNGSRGNVLRTVEAAWDIVRKNPKDLRVSVVEDRGDGVKSYNIDMSKQVGTLGSNTPSPLAADHVNLLVAKGRYLLWAGPANGAHYTGEKWTAPALPAAEHPAAALTDQQIADRLVAAGANATVAKRAAKQVRLGIPSPAHYGEADDNLRVRNGYVLSMNGKTKVLNWASWVTTKADYNPDLDRSNDWRPDPTLGDPSKIASLDDYRGAGFEYHRGHMVRSGERASSRRENEKTFVLSNAVPQAKYNNIGAWNGLEIWVNDRANEGATIYNQAGPVFSGPAKVLGKGVAVPTSLFKVVTVLAPGETTITDKTRVVAVMIPNSQQLPLTANWADYRVSVADVERATGLRFFENLPAALADKLRAKKDTVKIPYVMPPYVKEELEKQQSHQHPTPDPSGPVVDPTKPAVHGPSLRYLKWNAIRGNDGKPVPQGDQWPAFNGSLSKQAYDLLAQPSHVNSVPLTGVQASAPQNGTVTLKSIASDLVKRGSNAVIADRAAANILTGMPSNATATSKDDLLLVRKDRVESYSNTRRGPNWVAWKISKSDVWHGSGSAPRNDNAWRVDPSLPANASALTFHDYEGAGFDPGHMIASADREGSVRDNLRTYVTSNTLPQSFNNNRGPWAQMEGWIRNQVDKNDLDAYVMAGGTFGKDPYKIGAGASVPNGTWKIVTFVKKGQSIDSIGPDTKVVAINIPNDDRRVTTAQGFQHFITTPAEIEKQTGLKFFTNLPAATAEALRNHRDAATGVTDPQNPFPNTPAPPWTAPAAAAK